MKKKNLKQPETTRAHVFYAGRVQGVGFRYTAERLALDLGLTGWVKNLQDGRVELVCEGPRETIDELFERIRQSELGRHIRSFSCEWEPATREFEDFRVEFQF